MAEDATGKKRVFKEIVGTLGFGASVLAIIACVLTYNATSKMVEQANGKLGDLQGEIAVAQFKLTEITKKADEVKGQAEAMQKRVDAAREVVDRLSKIDPQKLTTTLDLWESGRLEIATQFKGFRDDMAKEFTQLLQWQDAVDARQRYMNEREHQLARQVADVYRIALMDNSPQTFRNTLAVCYAFMEMSGQSETGTITPKWFKQGEEHYLGIQAIGTSDFRGDPKKVTEWARQYMKDHPPTTKPAGTTQASNQS